jgi:hypothetical protein
LVQILLAFIFDLGIGYIHLGKGEFMFAKMVKGERGLAVFGSYGACQFGGPDCYHFYHYSYLYGYDGTKYYYLSNIILLHVKKGYSYHYNPYNIQSAFIDDCDNFHCKKVAESECGELICYRIIYKDLNDLEFYKKCVSVGPIKIFKVIKSLVKEVLWGWRTNKVTQEICRT